jgi:hypothetical protein
METALVVLLLLVVIAILSWPYGLDVHPAHLSKPSWDPN